MKLFGSTEKKKTKTTKNSEDIPNLEITEVILFHFNVVNIDCQQDSGFLNAFVKSKSNTRNFTNFFLKK